MVEGGDGSGFAFEAIAEVRGGEFDGDGAVEAGINGSVDLAHAAGSEEGFDFVGAELGGVGARDGLGSEEGFDLGTEVAVVAACFGQEFLELGEGPGGRGTVQIVNLLAPVGGHGVRSHDN